jgi:hypothetical protein
VKHFYLDDVWEVLGKLTGCWQCLMHVLVRHAHASWTGSHDATTAHTNSFWDIDDKAFNNWKEHESAKAADRVLALMEAKGIRMIKPEVKDVRLLIASPCGDGKYERLYVHSLMGTMQLLKQHGAQVSWMEEIYSSDLVISRNKLFGAFLRSDFTHMLLVDSDQGWKPYDVIRMLMHKRDFIAAAGIRKVFPRSFAVNVTDDFGNSVPLKIEPQTMIAEVSEVGSAFCVVTKAWAERMAAAYQDLQFRGTDDRKEYGIYNPMIVRGKYKSEDFAVCHRWRSIGGKLYVLTDVSLDHVGAFVWRGAWIEELLEIGQQQAQRSVA